MDGFPAFDFETILKKAATKVERHPVMKMPNEYEVFHLTEGFDRESVTDFINSGSWAVGGYLEKRMIMYLAPQYKNRRNIHMGVDIWAPAGEPVYAAMNGTITYTANHNQEGNYGGTIVLKHTIEGQDLFALYGHLSLKSLEKFKPGKEMQAGDLVGWVGNESENGNWPPHLHYQLSIEDPGKADMPGVVSQEDLKEARKTYPDPRILLGDIY